MSEQTSDVVRLADAVEHTVDAACWNPTCDGSLPWLVARMKAEAFATARADERERITVAVEDEREGFLRSDTLDPTWIAGWHAAVDWVAYRLNQRDYPPASPMDGAA